MKKILVFASSVLVLLASCQKSPVHNAKGDGFLSFGEFSLEVDEAVVTKADPAGDNYSIRILNDEDITVITTTYVQVKENGDKITLPAGVYTLTASSLAGDVPMASWENPIYGVSKKFIIKAGEVTEIGNLTCTLLQCKVTVDYSDEFLAGITGAGEATVEVTAGHPLTYALNADGSYEKNAGYFAVGEGSTMTVIYKGSFGGKSTRMQKTFTGISAKQWRQIKFIPKKNEQGDATFDIVINDLISDEVLNNTVDANEEVIGEDPDAPKGDGGITLEFDYEAGCDEELTDLTNMIIVPADVRDMAIKLKATVPGGILKFSVEVQSDNAAFNNALDAAGGAVIDLINPSAANEVIFQVVPFPHGQELLGLTEVAFDLSAAQDAIINYRGVHTFLMTIVDNAFCTNKIPVTMIVE
ncbi:MAG: DUF4493 domain-containing protein [Bacteroidales bacterium]|nr:DUF4493 domain-containing protein [Bacteroidales bacterium]